MGVPQSLRTVEKLVDDYYALLYGFAFHLTGSPSEAEDLTQEAFCRAQLKLGQLRDWNRAKPWLFSILRNAYLHHIRDEKRLHQVSLDNLSEPSESIAEPLPEIDPEQLRQALQELPEAYRTPVILYYFEDFSYRDIAEEMNVPMGTVMSRLARAKGHLRQRLLSGRNVRQNAGDEV